MARLPKQSKNIAFNPCAPILYCYPSVIAHSVALAHQALTQVLAVGEHRCINPAILISAGCSQMFPFGLAEDRADKGSRLPSQQLLAFTLPFHLRGISAGVRTGI